MAAPDPPLDPIGFFGTLNVQNLIFPLLTYRESARLMRACRLRIPRHHYVHCNDLACESGAPVVQRPIQGTGWVQAAPTHVAAVAFGGYPVRTPCANRAQFYNAATAVNEPSFCMEPENTPPDGARPVPHQDGLTLVCAGCKAKRAVDWEWKMMNLKFGVCGPCRNWAISHMAPGQDDCICAMANRWTNNVNNNEPRYKHLCLEHEVRCWNAIRRIANNEISIRRRLVRARAKKKRGHNWTRKKGGRVVRTPEQRRRATEPVDLASPPQAIPTCYCGETIGPGDHRVNGTAMAPGPAVDAARVRNCVGCNRFLRRW